jgi:hypothetical protein
MNIVESTRKPDLIFYHNGKIYITSKVSKAIGANEGDVINIWQEKQEYYLYVQKHNAPKNSKLVCHKHKKTSKNFLSVFSTTLSRAIIKESGGEKEAQLMVGEPCRLPGTETRCVPIITRINLYDQGN